MALIETYCTFSGFPDFMPMFNPKQMLLHGIHGGMTFSREALGLTIPRKWYDKGFNLDGVKISKYYNDELNAYKVKPLDIPPFLHLHAKPMVIGSPYISLQWFRWYGEFYYGRRWPEVDGVFIEQWKQVILWAYSKDAPKVKELDQLLLSYSWNPAFEPLAIKGYKRPK